MKTIEIKKAASPMQWGDWKWQMRNRISDSENLKSWINLTNHEKKAIESSSFFKMAATPHFASLMDKEDSECPLRKQAIPDLDEFKENENELSDPCGEDKDMVAPGLVHRYPDRVLFLITDCCAMYCRHCTRRRIVGAREDNLDSKSILEAISYIKKNEKIRDVLISGGDPLTLSDERLESLLMELKKIRHVEILRIGTRVPVVLPQRITDKFTSMLTKYQPLYMSIHFNHPAEISHETRKACSMLSNKGIPLGSQTVLLKGVNDTLQVMMKLFHELLKIRVRPYYLYQCDIAKGTSHFRTPVSTGIRIIKSLRGFTTGYAIPTFVIDAPEGGGKVPINPDYIISKNKKKVIIRNYENKIFVYPE